MLEALSNASQGLIGQIVDLESIEEQEQRPLEVSGQDDTERIVAFLNELLYLVYVKRWLPKRVRVLTHCARKGCRELSAILAGEPLDLQKHVLKYDIKAVTYHDFKVGKSAGACTIEFVCDL